MNPKDGKESQIGQSAAKSYAYLYGVYLGDGFAAKVSHRKRSMTFRLGTIDRDFAEATKDALSALGCHVWISEPQRDKRFSQSRPFYSLVSGATELCHRLIDTSHGKKHFPGCLAFWDDEAKKAFIAGLMDSEGYVAENRQNHTNRRFFMGFKVCDEWVYDFKALLESMGIRTNKIRVEKPGKPWYKVPRVFTIKMQSWIDSGVRFNIKRKNDRVDEFASAPAYTKRKRRPRRLSSETIRQTPESGEDIVRSACESCRGVEKSASAAN